MCSVFTLQHDNKHICLILNISSHRVILKRKPWENCLANEMTVPDLFYIIINLRHRDNLMLFNTLDNITYVDVLKLRLNSNDLENPVKPA